MFIRLKTGFYRLNNKKDRTKQKLFDKTEIKIKKYYYTALSAAKKARISPNKSEERRVKRNGEKASFAAFLLFSFADSSKRLLY